MKVSEFVNRENWCQRALAQDEQGKSYYWPYGETICKWCASGMIIYCYKKDGEHQKVFKLVKQYLIDHNMEPEGNIGRWNDRPERTWEDIRDLAITLDI
jgi:hypothetical protein